MKNDKDAQNLLEECIKMQNLNHPNLIKSYGFFSQILGTSKTHYFVQEHVPESRILLDRIAEHGKMSESEIVDIVQTILVALKYAHKKRIYHGDLRPSNILVSKGADFKSLKITGFTATGSDSKNARF